MKTIASYKTTMYVKVITAMSEFSCNTQIHTKVYTVREYCMYSISYNKLSAVNPCWKSTYRKAQNWLSSQQNLLEV